MQESGGGESKKRYCWVNPVTIQQYHQLVNAIVYTEIYGIVDERGLFVPSISLEETDETRGLIFCMDGHIVTLTGATEGIFKF